MLLRENTRWLYCEYQQPKIEILTIKSEGVICDSPDPGESEDVEYEDWN